MLFCMNRFQLFKTQRHGNWIGVSVSGCTFLSQIYRILCVHFYEKFFLILFKFLKFSERALAFIVSNIDIM